MLNLLSFAFLAAALSNEVTAVDYNLPITNVDIAPDGYTRS